LVTGHSERDSLWQGVGATEKPFTFSLPREHGGLRASLTYSLAFTSFAAM
jgi:hypothetical protein